MTALALALLFAFPHTAPLPPLPDSVYSTFGWVRVVREKPVDCSGAGPLLPNSRYIGCYDGSRRRLVVESGLDLMEAWRTLLHEEVHLGCRDMGIPYTPIEEWVANAVANRQLAEMLAK